MPVSGVTTQIKPFGHLFVHQFTLKEGDVSQPAAATASIAIDPAEGDMMLYQGDGIRS